jgi:hypothetical protein
MHDTKMTGAIEGWAYSLRLKLSLCQWCVLALFSIRFRPVKLNRDDDVLVQRQL